MFLKKKEAEALRVKTDSFVVESNVHFPTDYNLLWDSTRKAMDIISWFIDKYPNIEHWRKLNDWYKTLKNLSRAVGQASSGGGKGKDKRMKYAANKYLTKARAFRDKLKVSQNDLPIIELIDMANIIRLERFIELLNKHIDLVDRRIIKGENIPHQEKLFSIFEEYTEWITKGKRRPSVELGKKLSITTDHFGLILDYVIMENQFDSQIVQSTANRVLSKFAIKSWSFDKGYWHKDNKELLSLFVEELIMPKKGKPNKQEIEEENTPNFKKQRNKHSAVESNINELEHRGLDRCPDKGFYGFKRYIGIGIAAYNLRRIGKELIDQQIKKQERNKLRITKLAS
jgi:phage terminase Nu1 subunit (DNA packaging protein)